MPFRLRMFVAICIGLSVLGSSNIAEAAPIQFRMTGTIDVQFQVGPLPSGFFQGGPFEAILSYDLAAPDSRPDDPQRGYYFSPPVGKDDFLIIRAGISEIRSVHDLALFVGNDLEVEQEIFEFPDDSFALLDAEFLGNFEHSSIAFMAFRWNDPTRSALMSDDLPTSLDPTRFFDALSLNFTPPQFIRPFIEVRTFQFDSRAHQFRFRAFVDSIEVIPEPATISASAIAVAIIAPFFGKRRFHRGDR